jgi:uncharacterized peroxidase-related enzyme
VLHADGLTRLEQDQLMAALEGASIDGSVIPAADRALLEYADQLTRAPASITADDIAKLRAAGFEDRAIHDACAIAAYFGFVNRIADGLGVELEPSD